jgi:hypothetical protein
MKLNIFSKKKKTNKNASLPATDFLNPRDTNLDDSENENKNKSKDKDKEKKENSKMKSKLGKQKLENIEKNKKKLEDKQKKVDKQENKKEEKEVKKEKSTNKANNEHEFEKSNILEINLVKDQINVYFDWYKNIAMLVVFIFLSFLLVAEVYLALSWWQQENDSTVSQDEKRFVELNEETRKIRAEAEEALTFQTKLNKANYILDNHLYWSNFFDYLERNTLENIQYASFEGDILGEFSIPAVSDNFPSLGQQVYQLQADPDTEKVSIDSAEKLESEEENLEQVEFVIDLKINPSLFKK